jgi:hypothetical protein
MVRVWGGDLASYEYYRFDFVNRERQYILTPDDVKIYAVSTAFSPSVQVLSMEQSLEKAKATSLYCVDRVADGRHAVWLIVDNLFLLKKNVPFTPAAVKVFAIF